MAYAFNLTKQRSAASRSKLEATPAPAAVIYCCIAEDATPAKLRSQQRGLERYAQRKGFTVIRRFVDRGSSLIDRPGVKALWTYVRENPDCRAVLVESIDRLYRTCREFVAIVEAVKADGVHVHCLEQGYVLHKDAQVAADFYRVASAALSLLNVSTPTGEKGGE